MRLFPVLKLCENVFYSLEQIPEEQEKCAKWVAVRVCFEEEIAEFLILELQAF